LVGVVGPEAGSGVVIDRIGFERLDSNISKTLSSTFFLSIASMVIILSASFLVLSLCSAASASISALVGIWIEPEDGLTVPETREPTRCANDEARLVIDGVEDCDRVLC